MSNRKISISSLSNTQSDDSTSIVEIKRESQKYIKLDIKTYNKLIKFFKENIEYIQKMKKLESKQYQTIETQTDQILINLEDNQKTQNQNLINNDNIKEKESINNDNKTISNDNENSFSDKNKEVIDHKLIEEYSLKISALQEDIKNYQNTIQKLSEDFKNSIEKNKEILITKDKEIEKLKEEHFTTLTKLKGMVKISFFDQVITKEKIFDSIISYLPESSIINVISLNSKIHCHFFYKIKQKITEKKLKSSQNLISELTAKDLNKKYEIEEEQIFDLIKKYTDPHIIPGNKMRYSLFHALTFLENFVRKPLREHYDKSNNNNSSNSNISSTSSKFSNKAKLFLNEVYGIIKGEENSEINVILKKEGLPDNLNKKIISLNPKNIATNDIKESDKEFLKFMNDDKYINIKFEFENSEEIKVLLKYFFRIGLDKNIYSKFIQYIIDEFSDLFYNCYECINEIKEMEIVNHALQIRYNRDHCLMKEMTYELESLNDYNVSNKNIKEKLLKQKNELEIKYNNCLIMNSAMNKKMEESLLELNKVVVEKNKISNDFSSFKDKVIKDYKSLEQNLFRLKKERDILFNIFNEFKKYFFSIINGKGDLEI